MRNRQYVSELINLFIAGFEITEMEKVTITFTRYNVFCCAVTLRIESRTSKLLYLFLYAQSM